MWLVTEKQIPLCLDCYFKFSQIQQQELESNERIINYLSDQISFTAGLPPRGPRFPPRPQPTYLGGVALNNIHVKDSVVGAINTGTVGTIDVAITALKNIGETRIADAVTQVSEAILSSTVLDLSQKNEAAEILSLIAAEAASPPERRRASAIKPLLSRLRELVSVAADVSTIWQQWGPILIGFFS